MKTETAIFIDGSWLYMTTRRINKKIDFAKFFTILVKKFGDKTKIYYYGSIDPANKQQIRFYLSLEKIGYIIKNREIKKVDGRVISGGLDIDLIVDAMQVLPLLKNFVLVSGDSDFTALFEQANRIGVKTYVIALPFSLGYSLRRVANTFLNLETLIVERELTAFKKKREIENFANENYIKKGESFKSYIKLRDLMKSAKNNIVIIDSHIDDQILLMFQLLKPEIHKIIITDVRYIISSDFNAQVQKLKRDGHQIDIYNNKEFHDRFIRIDNCWWHSGHSFKDLGGKNSMFNKISETLSDELNNDVAKIV